ncbi:hypothetical protein H112_01471 [Trichophyton rubrum D6]|uniref:Uncharacterized protein n=3 Tax=Trichophyton TaxID=5550 RepID=A0A080WQD2_TRIRC|nr:uncharacterized protein TERG_12514 [Trichophyton rubrum CBS 118892]EZF26404.1 hypothetical protein H100_01466 [Trichophyton rubrum MR850]EZF45283.1 hypothetical protein H102_01462 [Trichophyton rubrum CBS 100081]EZF56033.1 hypothetical protein H103_01475 [Trichophyton rubrum CBS 288.86]EZF66684.1 hypothetical protein H104_01451 [Trichophyton rubrum CBS 289.86]EZF77302.1 hypothetical protein H105_01478 [Trichophyton soudanense CBS 452.61]EZF87994.1 hypothetical protein H110_01471 [Trichophy
MSVQTRLSEILSNCWAKKGRSLTGCRESRYIIDKHLQSPPVFSRKKILRRIQVESQRQYFCSAQSTYASDTEYTDSKLLCCKITPARTSAGFDFLCCLDYHMDQLGELFNRQLLNNSLLAWFQKIAHNLPILKNG